MRVLKITELMLLSLRYFQYSQAEVLLCVTNNIIGPPPLPFAHHSKYPIYSSLHGISHVLIIPNIAPHG